MMDRIANMSNLVNDKLRTFNLLITLIKTDSPLFNFIGIRGCPHLFERNEKKQ